MSFEIYLSCFASGLPAGIPRATVRELFPITEETSEYDYWRVRYDITNSCEIAVTPTSADDQLISSLCIDRPCRDARLWEAVFFLMKLGSVILYFPGSESPFVATEQAAEDVPKELLESIGQPKRINSAQEVLEIVCGV